MTAITKLNYKGFIPPKPKPKIMFWATGMSRRLFCNQIPTGRKIWLLEEKTECFCLKLLIVFRSAHSRR